MPCFFVSLKLCVWKKTLKRLCSKKNECSNLHWHFRKHYSPPSLSSPNRQIISIFRCIPLTSRFSERPAHKIFQVNRSTVLQEGAKLHQTWAVPHIASGSTAPCGYQMQHLSLFWDVAGCEKDSSNCGYPFYESGGVDRFASVRKRTFKRINGLSSLTFCCSCFWGKSSTSHCITLAKKQLPA